MGVFNSYRLQMFASQTNTVNHNVLWLAPEDMKHRYELFCTLIRIRRLVISQNNGTQTLV